MTRADAVAGLVTVMAAVRSALVDDLAVDDRGILGERHRRAAAGHRTRGRDAFAAGFSGLALARRRRRGRRR
ncbi:MAG: hypothetical protein ACRDMI_01495 [Streptosporangiaceae bacterium]